MKKAMAKTKSESPAVIEPNRLYSQPEVAELFGCCVETVKRYRRNRGMPFGNPTPGRVLGKQLIDWLKTARKHKSAAAN